MVAPLMPRLAAAFRVSEERIGLIVPAYMLPYGMATLFLSVALPFLASCFDRAASTRRFKRPSSTVSRRL